VSGSPGWLLAVMFLGAGAAIWAGIQLSEQTDVLTMRLGFGSALGGLILLAIATNLPEIAIVAAAAGKRHGCKPFNGGSVPRRPLTRVKCAAG
jgi:cation:H+ antiporter